MTSIAEFGRKLKQYTSVASGGMGLTGAGRWLGHSTRRSASVTLQPSV
jgi:hypothetical protein